MSVFLVPSPILRPMVRSVILAIRSSAMGPTATAGGDGHAAFACGAESGVDHGVGGQVEVGVGQDHRVVLRAAQGLDAFAGGGAGGVDVLRDRGRPHERHRS